ncbi:hypothetical protein AB0F77_35245 [Streptomyces sp. NPDC026672]|uniref:hypothetical protein n=1 Tax=unclassified Streptomyces TaxID=2593676 RepID=UPI0033EF2D68
MGALTVAAATVGLGAGSAQAATPETLEVCAHGLYRVHVAAPDLGIDLRIPPGACWQTGVTRVSGNPSYQVNAYAQRTEDGSERYIASALFRADGGLKLICEGTYDSPFMYSA